MQIDIAMTATLRASVIEKTLKSIYANMLVNEDINLRLVMNLDLIGCCKSWEVQDVVHQIMSSSVIYQAEIPDHVNAFRTVLSNSSSPYVLFWEDDYELCQPFLLPILIEKMQSDRSIGMIYLDRKDKSVLTHIPYKSCFTKLDDGVFYERTTGKSMGGPPALMSQKYIQSILPLIKGEPDILSVYSTKVQTVLKRWKHLTYVDNGGNFVQDIGRGWMKEQGIRRIKSEFGLEWVKSC